MSASTVEVSVITPSFRQLCWLKLCAASVADQQGVRIEHIIQDAGSGEELNQWAKTRPKLKLCVEKDRGMYDAINRGLRKSSGEICAYLNCDEQYLPGILARVVAYFQAHPAVEVLFGDAILTDDAARPLSYRRAVLPGLAHTRLVHLNTLSCAMFFRRSLVEQGFVFDPRWKMIGDMIWVFNLLKRGVRMACLPMACSTFAFTGNNLGAGKASEQEFSRWQAEPDTPPRWLRWPAIMDLRWRKLLAGAYRHRDVTIEIYTHDSPNYRTAFRVTRLGYEWPQPFYNS